MPAGNSTARPYNRSTNELVAAKKKLAERTGNKSRNKRIRESGEEYNDDRANTASNAKVGRGIFGANDVGFSDDALQALRDAGARYDNEEVKRLKKEMREEEDEKALRKKEASRNKAGGGMVKTKGYADGGRVRAGDVRFNNKRGMTY